MTKNPQKDSKELFKKQIIYSGSVFGFFKTLILAALFAGIIRSFLFEPFHIPSGSMLPNLLVGDYIFVSKYSYGYSRYSFPFGFNLFSGRILKKTPERGDIAVFRLPSDPSINYIKRVIGLPKDEIQIRRGILYINNQEIMKVYKDIFVDNNGDKKAEFRMFTEILPNKKEFYTLDQGVTPQDETGIYEIPQGHYFMMGDNRDNSRDSRFLNEVGFVPEENLVGKATIIFFSNNAPFWKIWQWYSSIRFKRIFQKL